MSAALWRWWERAFLAEVDARPLAAPRIAVGLLVLLTLTHWLPDVRSAFTDAGWLPAEAARQLMDPWHWSILHFVTSPAGVLAFVWLGVLAAVTMTLGLFSRTSAVVCAVVLASIHVRNPVLLYGADTVMRLLVIYTAVGRCGAVWSIDALVRRRRERLGRLRGGRVHGPVVDHATTPVFPLRLVQIQVCTIYVVTASARVPGHNWHEGTALWYGLVNPMYSRFNPAGEPLADALVPLLTVMTWITLYWEFAFPVLVPFRWGRRIALGFGVLIHGGIAVFLDIQWWGPVMLIGYLAFVPARRLLAMELRLLRWGRARMSSRAVRLTFDPGRERDLQRAAWIGAADRFGLVRLEPGERWALHDAGGKALEGKVAVSVLAGLLPAAAPLGVLVRLPGGYGLLRSIARVALRD